MRFLLLLILIVPVCASAQTVRTPPPCTDPPTATPCMGKDGKKKRHTVEEWERIQQKADIDFKRQREDAPGLGAAAAEVLRGLAAGEPAPWAIVGATVVGVIALEIYKRSRENRQ